MSQFDNYFERGNQASVGRGRPKGTKNPPKADEARINNIRRALLGKEPEIRVKLIEMALSGDMQAIKLIYEKVLPSLKAVRLTKSFEFVSNNPLEQLEELQDQLSSGLMGIEQVEAYSKIIQLKLDARVTMANIEMAEIVNGST